MSQIKVGTLHRSTWLKARWCSTLPLTPVVLTAVAKVCVSDVLESPPAFQILVMPLEGDGPRGTQPHNVHPGISPTMAEAPYQTRLAQSDLTCTHLLVAEAAGADWLSWVVSSSVHMLWMTSSSWCT